MCAARRDKGEGSVFQRKDGLWTAQVELPNGKRKYKYCKSKAEAKAWLREQNLAIAGGTWVDKDNVLLSDFLDRYMADIAKPTVRTKTFISYLYLITNHILPKFGKVKLTDLRPDQIQSFYTQKLKEGLSPRTVKYIHAVWHKSLGQALRWGLVHRNVLDLVDPPSVKRKKPLMLTVEQAKQLLEHCADTRYYYIYMIAISCGLREGEILGLYVSDLDLDRGIIHVNRAVQYLPGQGLVESAPKTESGIRPVKIPASVFPELKEYVNGLKPDQKYLFETVNGTPMAARNVLRHFRVKLKELGFPLVTFHSLRHLHASILMLARVHPKVVQSRLGHSTIQLTLDTYSHLMPGMDEDAAGEIDKLF